MDTSVFSAPSAVTLYLSSNLLLAAAAAALTGIRTVNATVPRPLTHGQLLGIARALALAAVLLPVLNAWDGARTFSPVKTQIWSAPSMQTHAATLPRAVRIEVAIGSHSSSVPLHPIEAAVLLFSLLGMAIMLMPLIGEVRRTARAVREAHLVRRVGRVRIYISEREPVPLAAWFAGRALIILPASLLGRRDDMRLALRHEAQHHRQGDTRAAYAMVLIRALFGLNPAVHWLARQIQDLQEFACDEALERHPGHCTHTYCACLLRLAEAALASKEPMLRAGMAGWGRFTLSRRIEAVLDRPRRRVRTRTAALVAAVLVAGLALLSVATASPIRDRRLSRAAAVRLAAAASHPSAIPLEVNRAVVAQLNLLLGTPSGRSFLRASFVRMRRYGPMVRAALRRDGLPGELVALPLVESGYRNVAPKGDPGAGLWQLIGRTARHYGLQVRATHDERLNVGAETVAATRMLTALHRQLRSWPLAVMAYNSGVARVEAGIRATHSRDAWTLYRAGFGNDQNYLARVVAVILVLENPRLLQ